MHPTELSDPATPNPSSAEALVTRFVGRQPILDVQQRIFGYELLFRSGLVNAFSGDAEDATRQMVDNTLLIGLETLAPGSKAFINCTRTALVGRLVNLLPPDQTVLEVLETVNVDDQVVQACTELKAAGYQIALDDFIPRQSSSRLLALADYVKLDFRAFNTQELQQIQSDLAPFHIPLIAEKVETIEEFQRAIADGYQYFQGYFFSRPVISSSRHIPSHNLIYLQILSAVSRSPCDLKNVQHLLSTEPSICSRLLRLANAQTDVQDQATSVSQVLARSGDDPFRRLVTIAVAISLGRGVAASEELIYLALQRARFCELLAPTAGQDAEEQYLIGLLSTADAILHTPMEQVLNMLPLRKEATAALLGEDTAAALPLRLIHCYEAKKWTHCTNISRSLNITDAQLTGMYVSASQWATRQIRLATI